ncbi:MAG: hypothetical protein B6D57_00655, partial [Candidatus Coatesbacteria bacterium 4484_99]
KINHKGGYFMIPMIGIMIGFYVLTRSISFISRKGDREEHIVVKVFSIITGIVSIIGMLYMILA